MRQATSPRSHDGSHANEPAVNTEAGLGGSSEKEAKKPEQKWHHYMPPVLAFFAGVFQLCSDGVQFSLDGIANRVGRSFFPMIAAIKAFLTVENTNAVVQRHSEDLFLLKNTYDEMLALLIDRNEKLALLIEAKENAAAAKEDAAAAKEGTAKE
jgi:hypothetical protein